MANVVWGYGRSPEVDTGILQVLVAYTMQGGQLFGARRWPENPLTLTHVRWQGTTSSILVDAYRNPAFDTALSAEERDVWVQLALTFPLTQAPGGAESPWLPLAVEPARASVWVQLLRQAQAYRRSQPQSWPPSGFAASQPSSAWVPPVDVADLSTRRNLGGVESWSTQEGAGLGPRVAHAPVATPPQMPPRFPDSPLPASAAGGPFSPLPPSESGQWTGDWQREAPSTSNLPEVVVLPCIEVELPSLLDGQVGAAYRADFASDVARHFAQATRQIPQVRETRGWMRGDRLVLAARAVVGMGNRGATRAEG
jgi:hypothetical protein